MTRVTIWAAALLALLAVSCDKKDEKSSSPTTEAVASAPAPSAEPGSAMDNVKMPTLGEVPIPEDNPQSDAKVTLGRELFFDKRLSVDGSRSCYSCHLNENGTGGGDGPAVGAKEKKLTRHSPILWNVGYLPKLYWDGRADSLEAQAKGAWGGGNMGVGADNLEKKAKEIGKLADYKGKFEAAFDGKGASADAIAQAISAYERTLVCNDTKFDKYAKGDKKALSTDEKQGLELFMGKAGCVTCHAPPYFSTAYLTKQGAFFNVGVGVEGKQEADVDVGRMAVTKADGDWAAFKPPSLRNVSKSAPYFHEGAVKTLKEAVKFMAGGGFANKNKSPLISDRKLSDQEISHLIAFLTALECQGKLEGPAAKEADKPEK